jgi:hypothetical protein
MRRPISLAACVVLLASCSASYAPAPGTTPSPLGGSPGPTVPATGNATQAPAPSGPSAEIEVDITGGPHDGAYRAGATNACHDMTAQNEFTVSYADNGAADGFVAFDLVVRDAATAISDESDDFLAHISLDGAGGGITYTLDPKNGQGDGRVFLDTTAGDATLDLEVDAGDGASIELTVLCAAA